MIDKNDPRLTAYALGELEASEAAAFEAALANEAEARAEVGDIRRAVDELRLALADETAPSLTDDQRQAIRASAASGVTERRSGRLRLLSWTLTAAAACLALAFYLNPRQGSSLQPLSLARRMTPESPAAAPGAAPGTEDRVGNATEAKLAAAAPPQETPSAGPATAMAPAATPLAAAAAETAEPAAVAAAANHEGSGRGDFRTQEATAPAAFAAQQEKAAEEEVAMPAAAAPPPTAGLAGPAVAEIQLKEMAAPETAAAGQPAVAMAMAAAAPAAGAGGGDPFAAPGDAVALAPRAPALAAKARVLGNQLEANAATASTALRSQADDSQPENPFRSVTEAPSSTFALALDATSYDSVRNFLIQGQLPPRDAVHIEGLVNHFRYESDDDATGRPFSVRAEVTACPWKPEQRLVRITVQRGRQGAVDEEVITAKRSRRIADAKAVATLDAAAAEGGAAHAVVAVDRDAGAEASLRVEFSPARVAVYRLIGDDSRLATLGLNEDAEVAGALRPGQTVTTFYQVVPAAAEVTAIAKAKARPPLAARADAAPAAADILLIVTLRWRPTDAADAGVLAVPVSDRPQAWGKTSRDLQFGSAVALFGMLLRQSPHAAGASLDTVLALATPAAGWDPDGERAGFLELVRQAKRARQAAP
jgi:hypothetical protein